MKQLTNLQMQVDDRDVGIFYELLGVYHKSRDDWVSSIRNWLDDNAVGHDKSIKSSMARVHQNSHGTTEKASAAGPGDSTAEDLSGATESFYTAVCKQCTCGTCFNRFASARREPWIPRGGGLFTNCKLGRVTIAECPVKDITVSGYIYVNEAEWNREHKIIDKATETSLSAVKRELQQTKIAGEQIKQKRELDKIQQAEEKRKAKELEAERAAEEKKERELRKEQLRKEVQQIKEQLAAIPRGRINQNFDSELDESLQADEFALRKYSLDKPDFLPSVKHIDQLYQGSELFEFLPKSVFEQCQRMVEGYRREYFKNCDQERGSYDNLNDELVKKQHELDSLGSSAKSGVSKKYQNSTPFSKRKQTSRHQARK